MIQTSRFLCQIHVQPLTSFHIQNLIDIPNDEDFHRITPIQQSMREFSALVILKMIRF